MSDYPDWWFPPPDKIERQPQTQLEKAEAEIERLGADLARAKQLLCHVLIEFDEFGGHHYPAIDEDAIAAFLGGSLRTRESRKELFDRWLARREKKE